MALFRKKERPKTIAELEEEKLQAHLSTLTPGTEAYDRVQTELIKHEELTGRKIERSQKLTKEARGNIWTKVVGAVCTGGLLGFMVWSEKKNGYMLSGANEKVGGGLLKGLSGLIWKS